MKPNTEPEDKARAGLTTGSGPGDAQGEPGRVVQGKETDSALEATVSAFVDQILQEALRLRATDVHLEPYINSIRLRYRPILMTAMGTIAGMLPIALQHAVGLERMSPLAVAAIGGLLIASHIGQINFAIGFIAGIKAFTAAVLGGIGSIPGAVLGSLVLGLTESFATGYVSSDYEDVFAFSLLVLILIFKPSGLLGKADTKKV